MNKLQYYGKLARYPCPFVTRLSPNKEFTIQKWVVISLRRISNTWWRHQMDTCNWPFLRGSHRSPMDSPHKGQWCRPLMYSLICALTNDWENTWDAGDLRRHTAHVHVTVMTYIIIQENTFEHVFCNMASILSRPQCVYWSRPIFYY